MSEARDKYLKNLETYDCEYFGCQAEDYVAELEQQITELKESQKQKQIIRLCERLDEAKQQNERMIELLIEYLKSDFTNGTDDITVKNQELIESVTGKPIEEATK